MTRHEIVAALWHGRDPFADPPEALRPLDLQGWRSIHPFLAEAVTEMRPEVVVEIGTWKGASTLYLARLMAEHGVVGTSWRSTPGSARWTTGPTRRSSANSPPRTAIRVCTGLFWPTCCARAPPSGWCHCPWIR